MGVSGFKVDIYVVVLSAVGVTNQRETTLVWDKVTGEPLYNAIGGYNILYCMYVSVNHYCQIF